MARLDDAERVQPASRQQWRAWLEANHATSPGVWLVSHTKASGKQQLSYEDVVEELLCFGWVDSTARKIDPERSALYVAPRKRGGTWAATNKARIQRLEQQGLMTEAGRVVIDRAKADGSWTILDPVEALEVPPDLAAAFTANPSVAERYEALGVGAKKQVLWSVVSAKRAETRAARIAAIVQRGLDGSPLVP
jgi:uncharacterized protein YdeI (YjbR/CyaY-like superfamily)